MTISAPITITPIQITAPVTFGTIGPQGPNAVTSATTSNGTATLSLAGITIAAFTSGHVVTVTTGGAFTTTSRSGIDTRNTFPPASHTHTASDITDFAAAVAATAPQSHSHGNITNAGAIGSTADLVVTTGTGGILETTSRSGIDSRTSFPNADVTAATSAATINTLVKRSSLNGFTINTITLDPYNGSTGALVVNDDSATLVISPQTLTTSQEQRWPNGSGTYGLVLSDTGAIASTDITDFAAAVAGTAPQAHSHGNITNAGAIGSTADLVVITGSSGVLTTTSRSGIDSRTSFPNADVTAATTAPVINTIAKRDANGWIGANYFYAGDDETLAASGVEYGFLGTLSMGWSATPGGGLFSLFEITPPTSFTGTTGRIYRLAALSAGTTKTLAITSTDTGIPDQLTNGTIDGTLTINSTTINYGTGSAAAHRTALGLTALATTTPGTGVATALSNFTSTNIRTACTDPTGTGSLVFASFVGDMGRLGNTSDVSITGATTLTASAFGAMHVCSGTAADYTVTLPSPSGNAGRMIAFRMSNALTRFVTLSTPTGLIDGVSTRIMWAQETAVLYCDGTDWTKVSGKSRPLFASGENGAGVSCTNSTVTPISLATNIRDNSTRMVDTVSSTSVFRIRRAGNYSISALVTLERVGSAAGFEAYAMVLVNSLTANATSPSMLAVTPTNINTAGTTTFAHVQLSNIRQLALSDYVALAGFQSTGTTMTTRTVDVVRPHLSIIESPTW